MTRQPDIDLDRETIPAGLTLIKGKRLMLTARSAKIPYGMATVRERETKRMRSESIGIIIAESDKERFMHALANKNPKKKKTK